jgi:hypothetical protein
VSRRPCFGPEFALCLPVVPVRLFEGKYQSFDLDFILQSATTSQELDDAMEGIGFRRAGSHYEHPRPDSSWSSLRGPLESALTLTFDQSRTRSGKSGPASPQVTCLLRAVRRRRQSLRLWPMRRGNVDDLRSGGSGLQGADEDLYTSADNELATKQRVVRKLRRRASGRYGACVSGRTRTAVVNLRGDPSPPGYVSSTKNAVQPEAGAVIAAT